MFFASLKVVPAPSFLC